MAPGLLLNHSKDNEANQQEADPDNRAEMTSRFSGVVHWLALPAKSKKVFLFRAPPPTGSPEQTGTPCAACGCEFCSRLSSHLLLVRWYWRLGLRAPSVSRFTSVRGCPQQSWVASSQGTFKPMRGAGSAFSIVRSEGGQARVIETSASALECVIYK